MSVIAVFPRYLGVEPEPEIDSEFDYTPGEKYLGRFLGRRLYQTTVTIPLSSIPTTGFNSYNYYSHGIANIDVPLYIFNVSSKNTGASSSYSKDSLTMQAFPENSSQWHLYFEKFTRTQFWIYRGTSAASEADRLYVTVRYFKSGE